MRLLANRLLGEPGLQEKIEDYARNQLMRIVQVGGGLPPGEAREPAEADVKMEQAPSQARLVTPFQVLVSENVQRDAGTLR